MEFLNGTTEPVDNNNGEEVPKVQKTSPNEHSVEFRKPFSIADLVNETETSK